MEGSTLYFVDMMQMNETLDFFDRTLPKVKDYSGESDLDKYALERMTHVLIEAFIDTGNMMIDGFIMRDPGSYLDIVHILVDEQVINKQDQGAYEVFVSLRKHVVQEYKQIDHARLMSVFIVAYEPLSRFSSSIRQYLANEIGVANTFTNKG